MKRAIIKYNDKESILNVAADRIVHEDNWIKVYLGEELVVIAWGDCVDTAYITERKGTEK